MLSFASTERVAEQPQAEDDDRLDNEHTDEEQTGSGVGDVVVGHARQYIETGRQAGPGAYAMGGPRPE